VWLLAAMIAGGCNRAQPVEEPAPALQHTATIRDIMDSMVDPSGEFLFESVATIGDEQGVREIAPQTDEEWQEVRRRAMILVEAPNLLVMPGRAVAPPNVTAQNPAIELEPAQIQALIDGDRPAFIARARALQDAALLAVKAADAKDKTALFAASERIDVACETCHLGYWYPNDKRAQELFKENQRR
jgi:hypothetical protein